MNRFTILPGQASNMAEVIASLKKRGFYSSGVPRTGPDAEVRRKPKKAVTFRVLSSKELRYLSPEDYQAYINHAMREKEQTT